MNTAKQLAHEDRTAGIREAYDALDSDVIWLMSRCNDEDHKEGKITDSVWENRRAALHYLRQSFLMAAGEG